MAAFVLGNGESRRCINLDDLSRCGVTYGCNALYRDFTPSVLVATDRPISTQIQESGYGRHNVFYTRRPMSGLGAREVPRQYFGYSSGPLAAAIAAQDGHNPIYLVGFDMGPAGNGLFNNVYADTEFYKPRHSQPTYAGNWVKQISRIVRDYTNRTFVRVHGTTTADIADFDALPNLQRMAILDFLALINNTKDPR